MWLVRVFDFKIFHYFKPNQNHIWSDILYQIPINHDKIPIHLMWLSVHFFKIGLFAHSARQTILI
ncbi:Uncharacterised protein [Moraxella lacunata]|uniref:Uncharacterized protein n=1 Tax=Moraxella lacunata TaxID=477 RepID=A0A378QG26_MORLA|nr:Uncharacterised protein [Moraxella lacunata]